MTTISSLPTHTPLIVYAGVKDRGRIEPLRRCQVEAIMVSFENLRHNPDKFHENIAPLLDWPVRKYLDSGLYTLMRKYGVSRRKVHGAGTGLDDALAAYTDLSRRYARYLDKYGSFWHHVVELDVDQILGPEYTHATRHILTNIVGDKLVPVWHISAGMEEWLHIAARYPYIAIGGDIGPSGEGGSAMHARYRTMVQEAHKFGTVVHGLGDTREQTFRAIGWDTADSTTWLSTMRFGRLGGWKYSEVESTLQRSSRTYFRQLDDLFHQHGLDPQKVAARGNNVDKVMAGIIVMEMRMKRLREGMNRGQHGTRVPYESRVPVVPGPGSQTDHPHL